LDVCLVDLGVLDPPFDLLKSFSASLKAQYDAYA
jgi:hypothetical protein